MGRSPCPRDMTRSWHAPWFIMDDTRLAAMMLAGWGKPALPWLSVVVTSYFLGAQLYSLEIRSLPMVASAGKEPSWLALAGVSRRPAQC